MKNKAVVSILAVSLAISLLAFSCYIKEAARSCSWRPIFGCDLSGIRTVLEAFIDDNNKRYPRLDYKLPRLDNRLLIKRDFDKFNNAFLRESGILYQDLILDRETVKGRNSKTFSMNIETGRNKFILPPDFTNANSFSVKNTSGRRTEKMSLILNDRDWSSIDGILSTVIPGHTSDKAKAFAIWEFLKDNLIHFDPPDKGAFTHDPVKLVNITGYGICDDAAISFAVLARHAGLKARVWGLTGHVTSEVFYDGAWHMLDPDQGIYYLTLDGKKAASVSEISKDPVDIIGRTKETKFNNKERFIKVYGTRSDNRVIDKSCVTPSTYQEIQFSLIPGEEITFWYGKRGPWYAKDSWVRPPVAGSVTDKIELSDEGTFASVQNSGIELTNGRLVSTGDGSHIIWSHRLPYPILDIRIDYGSIAGNEYAKGMIEIYLSKDGKIWKKVQNIKAESPKISLKRLIDNFDVEPAFEYFVKMVFLKRGLSVDRITSEAEAQANPSGPFRFRPAENVLEIRSDSEAVLGLALEYE